jgi:AraC family transcriptional regulator of arabinose operon
MVFDMPIYSHKTKKREWMDERKTYKIVLEMTQPASLAIVPPTRLLVAGRQDSTQRIYARRSAGTADWLLIYTEKGQAYFRFKGGEFTAKSDDLILIKPGTPHDYGLEEKYGHWKNTWIHFNPRPDCLAWLKWPEITKGLMHLHLEPPLRESVRKELRFMESTIGESARRGEEMAANALERVLLLCDSVNPLHYGNKIDPRIRKAVELLSLSYHSSFTLDGLARECGLSRSRLAELFRKETGSAPMTFLETRRMRRAQELFKYTSFSLAEIAEQTGFSSPFYLSLRFKKHYGISPRAYRKKNLLS